MVLTALLVVSIAGTVFAANGPNGPNPECEPLGDGPFGPNVTGEAGNNGPNGPHGDCDGPGPYGPFAGIPD